MDASYFSEHAKSAYFGVSANQILEEIENKYSSHALGTARCPALDETKGTTVRVEK